MKYLQKLHSSFSGTAKKFYSSKEWRSIRRLVLSREPLCRSCELTGLLVPATEVDHIEPLVVAWNRRLDLDNLQPICKVCHAKKTREDNKDNIHTKPEIINPLDNLLNDMIDED
jgi:5-methylcytosine-specific restriction endonuclease McrA